MQFLLLSLLSLLLQSFYPDHSQMLASQFYTADLVLGFWCCLPAVCLIKWHRHFSLSFKQSFKPTMCLSGRFINQCSSSSSCFYIVEFFLEKPSVFIILHFLHNTLNLFVTKSRSIIPKTETKQTLDSSFTFQWLIFLHVDQIKIIL